MYVCVCHAVTEDDVRRHAAQGIGTAKDLRYACGMRPGCGQCVRRICALLEESGGVQCPLTSQSVSGAVAA